MAKLEWLKLAILYDKDQKYSPSNEQAIAKFCESAYRKRINPTIIKSTDFDTLPTYDGLLIRDTTHPGNYTYEFAHYAAILGIPVVDNAMAIQQGCNKIWQAKVFKENRILHPMTWLDRYNSSLALEFPCVLKVPDSCFSQGVYKCNNILEYQEKLKVLRGTTQSMIVCQEFIPTDFDWRIVIFNNKFLFACKYWMVDGDWKIVKYDRKGEYISGNHECVPEDKVPQSVMIIAAKCNKILTEGLYGIDIKEVDDKAYVIEINDNPSIDAGVEDELEGQKIYDTIIEWYRTEIIRRTTFQ